MAHGLRKRLRNAVFAALLLATLQTTPPAFAAELDALPLRDADNAQHQLAEFQSDFVVVIFLGLDCPLCKLYAERLNELATEFGPQVQFVGVVANRGDELSEISQFQSEFQFQFPVYKDVTVAFADALNARFNPEVIVLDRERTVRYRGRIDDQYVPGLSRESAEQQELRSALRQLVGGQPVTVVKTKPIGCLIQRPVVAAKQGELTYFPHVQPIVQRRCGTCHCEHGKAPFELSTYDDVATWSDTIQLVLEERRMPPWFADPAHGDFSNDAAITEIERAQLLRWINDGVPRGDAERPVSTTTKSRHAAEWSIPTPNLVVGMQEPFTVPATGTLEYQYILIDLSFEKELWVQAAEIKPGNPQVVHHCVVMLVPPHGTRSANYSDGSLCFVVDSLPQLNLPTGLAKKIPAGWRLMFIMHYTPIGSEQTDQTQLGLRLVDADEVRQEVATRILYSTDIRIPPHEPNYRREIKHTFDRDVDLLSLFPHMHYRGNKFYYEVAYPDGRTETLLNLKKWDFNWQHNYVFRQPKRIPAGSVLTTVGFYDNSKQNAANPDPDVWVEQGNQTTNEMFNAYFDYVEVGQDLQQTRTTWIGAAGAWIDHGNWQRLVSCLAAIALIYWLGQYGPQTMAKRGWAASR